MSLGMVVALSREIAVKFSYTTEPVLGYNAFKKMLQYWL